MNFEVIKDFQTIRGNNKKIEELESENASLSHKYKSADINIIIDAMFRDPYKIPSVTTIRRIYGRHYPLERLIGKRYPQILKIVVSRISGYCVCHICGRRSKPKIITENGFVVDCAGLTLVRTTNNWTSVEYFEPGKNLFFLCWEHYKEYREEYKSDPKYFNERKIETPLEDAIRHRVKGSFESGKR